MSKTNAHIIAAVFAVTAIILAAANIAIGIRNDDPGTVSRASLPKTLPRTCQPGDRCQFFAYSRRGVGVLLYRDTFGVRWVDDEGTEICWETPYQVSLIRGSDAPGE